MSAKGAARKAAAAGARVCVHVRPGVRGPTGIEVIGPNTLQLRTSKPAREGEANADVCVQVAAFFKVPKSSVSIISGATSKEKMVSLTTLTLDDIAPYFVGAPALEE